MICGDGLRGGGGGDCGVVDCGEGLLGVEAASGRSGKRGRLGVVVVAALDLLPVVVYSSFIFFLKRILGKVAKSLWCFCEVAG